MNRDSIIGRPLLVDGAVRPEFTDDGGHQYVIGPDGYTRRYGAWLRPDQADVPTVVAAPEPTPP
jgi:hypothetical protein